MDEFFVVLLALLLLVLVLAAPVLAVVVLVRTKRIGGIERELAQLRKELDELGQRPPTATAPEAGPEPPVREAPDAIGAITLPPPPLAPTDPLEGVDEPEPHEERAVSDEFVSSTMEDEMLRAQKRAELVVTEREAPAPRTPKAPTESSQPSLGERLGEIEWERWLGIRGAAVLGGIVASLAAVLFFKHAFQEGWIQPWVRVAMGCVAGVAGVAGGALLRKRAYKWLPAAVEGAGIVAFYATVWAAHTRYHFFSMTVAFPLMGVVTALSCYLAFRNREQLGALLGLFGGFATPLLLASGEDRPFGLFGYILLLDSGLLLIGHKRRWPSLGLLALLGTFFYENVWIFGRLDAERLMLGLAIVSVFAVLFAFTSGLGGSEAKKRDLTTQAGALLFPFVFAFYFAGRLELGGHLWPTALLLGLLCASACVLERRMKTSWLPMATAGASAAVAWVWCISSTPSTNAELWELVAVLVGLAAVPSAFCEWHGTKATRSASLVSVGGSMLLLILVVRGSVEASVWPLFAGLGALTLLALRRAWTHPLPRVPWLASGAFGVGLLSYLFGQNLRHLAEPTDTRLYLLALLPLVAVLALLGWRNEERRQRDALRGVWVFLLPALWPTTASLHTGEFDPWLTPLASLFFGVVLFAVATRLRSVVAFGASLLLVLVIQASWQHSFLEGAQGSGAVFQGLCWLAATAVVLALWPAFFRRSLAGLTEVRALLSLPALFWFAVVMPLWEERFGDDVSGLPALLLGCLPAIVFLRDRNAWSGAIALLLFAAILPLQVDHSEVAVCAALWALGLAFLSVHLQNQVTALLSALVAALSAATLSGNYLDWGTYAHAELPLWNALGYGHALTLAAMVITGMTLRRVQVGEDTLVSPLKVRTLLAALPGLAAVVTLFLWINLEILNHFTDEPRIRWVSAAERSEARDLSLSVAWGAYALLLLGLGTWKSMGPLRWTSLALMFLAIGKVFLFDLGHLEGLYRVGSLAGLAISLLAVSAFYQRFVFRRTPTAEEQPEPAEPRP